MVAALGAGRTTPLSPVPAMPIYPDRCGASSPSSRPRDLSRISRGTRSPSKFFIPSLSLSLSGSEHPRLRSSPSFFFSLHPAFCFSSGIVRLCVGTLLLLLDFSLGSALSRSLGVLRVIFSSRDIAHEECSCRECTRGSAVGRPIWGSSRVRVFDFSALPRE